jgi:hypothetical protein
MPPLSRCAHSDDVLPGAALEVFGFLYEQRRLGSFDQAFEVTDVSGVAVAINTTL